MDIVKIHPANHSKISSSYNQKLCLVSYELKWQQNAHIFHVVVGTIPRSNGITAISRSFKPVAVARRPKAVR